MSSLSFFTFMHWRINGNPLQCSCLENPRDRGAWWAAVYRVEQSRTRLKRLSSRGITILHCLILNSLTAINLYRNYGFFTEDGLQILFQLLCCGRMEAVVPNDFSKSVTSILKSVFLITFTCNSIIFHH